MDDKIAHIIRVSKPDEGKRIDRYIAEKFPAYSRSKIRKIIEAQLLQVHTTVPSPAYRVKDGDEIRFFDLPHITLEPIPQNIPLDIVFEDENLLIINKPAGMVVHPAAGNADKTVLNAVLGYTRTADVTRAGIVHRLDKETSGLLAIAKNELTLAHLQGEFKSRKVTKKYLTLVWGKPKTMEGLIDAPIGRSGTDRKKMGITQSGRSAQTYYKVIREYKNTAGQIFSLLEVTPKTGRTHQIRVHAKSIGLPVVGDKTYGRKTPIDNKLGRQFLHAYYLAFTDVNGVEREFQTELPLDLKSFLDYFK